MESLFQDRELWDWGPYLDAAESAVSVDLQPERVVVELSLKTSGKCFALIYFDSECRRVVVRGGSGQEIPMFDSSIAIGRRSLAGYGDRPFFGDFHSHVSSNHCAMVLKGMVGSGLASYPVIAITDVESRNGTLCRVFTRKDASQTLEEDPVPVVDGQLADENPACPAIGGVSPEVAKVGKGMRGMIGRFFERLRS